MNDKNFLNWGGAALLLVCTGLSLPGCFVPQNRYDAAEKKIRDEQAAHRETREKLRELEAVVARVQSALDTQASELTQKEKLLLRKRLESDVETTARQDAIALVEQLRGELARAGDHLRHYSEKKQELEAALTEAEQRERDIREAEQSLSVRAHAVRELTLALADRLKAGTASIEPEQQRLVITLPSKDVFARGSHQLSAASASLLGRIGAALGPLERVHVEVTESPVTAADQPEDTIVKLQNISDHLAKAGLPHERVSVALPPEVGETADSVESTAGSDLERSPVAPLGEPKLRLSIAIR